MKQTIYAISVLCIAFSTLILAYNPENADLERQKVQIQIEKDELALEKAKFNDQLERQKRINELASQEYFETALTPYWLGTFRFMFVLINASAAFTLALGAYSLIASARAKAHFKARHAHKRGMHHISPNGPFPVSDDGLSGLQDAIVGAIDAQSKATVLKAASPVQLPNVTHYNPTISNHYEYDYKHTDNRQQPDQQPDQQAPATGKLLNFSDMVNLGHYSRQQDGFVLGYDPVTLEMTKVVYKKMDSLSVYGLSRTGKSTTVAALLCQAALNGFAFYIADPHHHKDDSLTKRLSDLVALAKHHATDETSIANQTQMIRDEMLNRKNGASSDQKILWIVDEVPAVMRLQCKENVVSAFEEMTQEARGFNMWLIAISQTPSGSKFGGAAIRECFPMSIFHRLKRATLSAFNVLDKVDKVMVEGLPVGEFVLDRDGETYHLRSPLVEESDVNAVARKIKVGPSTQNLLQVGPTMKDVLIDAESNDISVESKLVPVGPSCETIENETLTGGTNGTKQHLIDEEMSEKEEAAYNLAKTTDWSANKIHKAIGGNRGAIRNIVRQARRATTAQ